MARETLNIVPGEHPFSRVGVHRRLVVAVGRAVEFLVPLAHAFVADRPPHELRHPHLFLPMVVDLGVELADLVARDHARVALGDPEPIGDVLLQVLVTHAVASTSRSSCSRAGIRLTSATFAATK